MPNKMTIECLFQGGTVYKIAFCPSQVTKLCLNHDKWNQTDGLIASDTNYNKHIVNEKYI